MTSVSKIIDQINDTQIKRDKAFYFLGIMLDNSLTLEKRIIIIIIIIFINTRSITT